MDDVLLYVNRVENDHVVAKNIAVAGMAALLIAGHPQMAMAKDVAVQGQVQLRINQLESSYEYGIALSGRSSR